LASGLLAGAMSGLMLARDFEMSVTAAHLPALAIDQPVSAAATALSLPVVVVPMSLVLPVVVVSLVLPVALEPAGAATPSRQVSITLSPDFSSLREVAALPSTGRVRLS
jgi:hypothetical protein